MSHMDLEIGLGDFRSLSGKFDLAGWGWAQHQGFASPINSRLSNLLKPLELYWNCSGSSRSHIEPKKPHNLWSSWAEPHIREVALSWIIWEWLAAACQRLHLTAAASPAASPQDFAYRVKPCRKRGSPSPFPLFCVCDCSLGLSSSLQPLFRP